MTWDKVREAIDSIRTSVLFDTEKEYLSREEELYVLQAMNKLELASTHLSFAQLQRERIDFSIKQVEGELT